MENIFDQPNYSRILPVIIDLVVELTPQNTHKHENS